MFSFMEKGSGQRMIPTAIATALTLKLAVNEVSVLSIVKLSATTGTKKNKIMTRR